MMNNNVTEKMVEVCCKHCGEYLFTASQEWLEDLDENRTFEFDGNTYYKFEGEIYCYDCGIDMFQECCECGEIIPDAMTKYDYNGNPYCDECAENYLFYCEHCGEYYRYDFTNDYSVYIDEYANDCECWCEHCVDNHAWYCSDCQEHFSNDVDHFDTIYGEQVCRRCCEGNYYVCEHCGEAFRPGDGDEDCHGTWYCDACYSRYAEDDDDDVIYNYHQYSTDWRFRSLLNAPISEQRNKQLFMGTELELDDGGDNSDNAIEITSALGYPADESDEFKCSQDGSLSNGFEIISMPATLDYHLKKYDWEAAMETAVDLGYKSHDPGTCGLHVHVDRAYFEDSMENPEVAVVILFANNKDWLQKFSRRKNFTYCAFHSSSRTFSPDDFKKDKELAAARAIGNMRDFYRGHGSALNFCGYSTIEFRLFRGTLKYSTFVASLQLVEMMCYAMKHFRKEQLCNIGLQWFKRFAARKHYDAFMNYIEERGIVA